MATAGPLLATTGSRADMGSPSSRHSIVFPLDGVSPSSPLPFSSTPRPAAIARTMTASRPAMDFELLQQQRLQQAAAALIATAAATAASSSASSPTSANEDGSSRRGGGRVLSSPSSSATSPCASSSSSMIITNTSSHHHHPTPAPLSSTSTTTAPSPSDPWRDQWLGPSGAMQSLFRDRPSKFNCPHCGARRVRSHIEFVPGVMSFLVSFGLLFLTVGTLSFLPFRKDHKATKDCVHWCPRCETRVARFVRASGTWEWM
ncbi:hypothetical protein BGZ73_005844 [Actinomortierella ambigua]|nr:hypothetical protein BGZ73_005844 [Actinomortierella ambigua]